jgi:hypothetical protein
MPFHNATVSSEWGVGLLAEGVGFEPAWQPGWLTQRDRRSINADQATLLLEFLARPWCAQAKVPQPRRFGSDGARN